MTEAHAKAATTPDLPVPIERILEMLPHRYPLLLIDRIVEIKLDESAVAIKNISFNEPQFQGHFPSHPVMPGVLLIEAMAQTAAALVVATVGADAEGKLVYFMTVDNARFRKPVTPGDQLRIAVEKERNRGNVWKFKGRCLLDGKVAAEANFSAMIVDR
ncbi:MAG: 3-hydroxyacyl-ACP dehydratase FabZ [Alphaproteobacteria bacterium]|nr:3-hydroxyacyl-ACP dehydratase FabZ [Alphaproteobacteria bacterium]MCB9930073.1 3-hydroxyacyl-ACP dehydratase FabZ [Alphaproteobacteria bacterium]